MENDVIDKEGKQKSRRLMREAPAFFAYFYFKAFMVSLIRSAKSNNEVATALRPRYGRPFYFRAFIVSLIRSADFFTMAFSSSFKGMSMIISRPLRPSLE
jgi:hypothetical protein